MKNVISSFHIIVRQVNNLRLDILILFQKYRYYLGQRITHPSEMDNDLPLL